MKAANAVVVLLKAKVIVGLSVSEEGCLRFLKMEVAIDLKSDSIAAFAEVNIEVGSTISSDAYSSYKQLSSKGYNHKPKIFNPKADKEHLKWLHVIVSNAKHLSTEHSMVLMKNIFNFIALNFATDLTADLSHMSFSKDFCNYSVDTKN